MSRKAKGARLYERTSRSGVRRWVILDTGGVEISTGAASRGAAEKCLADYIFKRDQKSRTYRPDEITIGQVLEIYAEEHGVTVANPERIAYAIEALDPFWGNLTVSDVKGETCRRYASWRGRAPGTVRRELGTLSSAITHCVREGYLTQGGIVTLPTKTRPKDRWLTRTEAYWLLRGARQSDARGRHLQWFIILGLATGTRRDASLNLALSTTTTLTTGRLDPETGILHRSGRDERTTKKRRGSARMPRRLLSHVRRKHKLGHRWFVQSYRGDRVGSIKTSFASAITAAEQLAKDAGHIIDLSDVTPHTLKHTAITWAMHAGARMNDMASYFDTTAETIERVYGHHHPDHQGSVIDAIDRRGRG